MTHEVVPVVENEDKIVKTKDPATGEEKTEVLKVPVTKNKVVPKAAVSPLGGDGTATVKAKWVDGKVLFDYYLNKAKEET